MKIVHTGDWHIGKTIRGKHRDQEYCDILDELKTFLVEKNVDVLLVAGDIFDLHTPPAAAENIVYNFFYDISKLGIKALVIAGNHDSKLRFKAISKLMALAGIIVRGYNHRDNYENIVSITSKKGEKAEFALLPFIFEHNFVRTENLIDNKESATNLYSKGVGEVLADYCKKFDSDSLKIVVGHVLLHGASPGGSERRLYLGDNYALHPGTIPENIDYMAAGHIHLCQKIPAHIPIYYCGSLLQLDFGELNAKKGFFFIDTSQNYGLEPQFIEITRGKELKEIRGNLEELRKLAQEDLALQDKYLRIVVRADTSTVGVSYQVKKIFPNAVDIRREYPQTTKEELKVFKGVEWFPQLYKEFYKKQYSRDIPKNLLTEFKHLCDQFS